MKKVLNILVPLFILFGILDLLIYSSNQEEVAYETEEAYYEIEDSASTDDDFPYSLDDYDLNRKFTLRIEKFCYMTSSVIKLEDEFGEVFHPTPVIPYNNQHGIQYAFLQFENLPIGEYHISIKNPNEMRRRSLPIEIKNSMVLSYQELIDSFFSIYNLATDSYKDNFTPLVISLVISIYDKNEGCFQRTFTITKSKSDESHFEIELISPSSRLNKKYKVKPAFWKDIANLEYKLANASKEKWIDGKVDFSLYDIKTYPNVYDFEIELFKIIEKHKY